VFQAFYGISGLLEASPDFYGLPDYASTMSFELRWPANSSGTDGLFVRFGFRNGSLPSAELKTFPLFGRSAIEADIPWSAFVSAMSSRSISSQKDWCHACGGSNQTFCAAYTSMATNAINTDICPSVSPVAAGFIGAGVAIAAIIGREVVAALLWWHLQAARRSASEKVGSEDGSERVVLG